jgi:hypothetical protein
MRARVSEELDQPPWMVIHNVPRPGRGNVDHFVAGPSAAFVIETKSGKLRGADRGQAISNAIWAKQNFGQRYVAAVVCATNDAPSEPVRVPHGNAWLWIVAPSQLRKLIEGKTGRTETRRRRAPSVLERRPRPCGNATRQPTDVSSPYLLVRDQAVDL